MKKNLIIASLVAASVSGSVSAAPMASNIDLKLEKQSQAVLLEKMLVEFTPIMARPECTVKGI